jgi:hypothetical protein
MRGIDWRGAALAAWVLLVVVLWTSMMVQERGAKLISIARALLAFLG